MSNSRYPYTYAYDFIRANTMEYSEINEMNLPQFSRSQCARICHAIAPALGMMPVELAEKIADYSGAKKE